MSGIELKQEKLSSCLEELRPLLEQHKGIVGGQLSCEAEVDWDFFHQLEQHNVLHLTTARSGGCLQGYIFWFLADSGLEYKDIPNASQGPWFVKPSLHRTALGRDLFLHSIDSLRELGVRYVLPHHWEKGSGAKLGSFFASLGAVPIERSFLLDLGRTA